MTKVKKLSIIFIGLLIVSVSLTWMGGKKEILSGNKGLFAIADTTQISRILIGSNENVITISKGEGQWSLNDQYVVDPQLIYLSQRILNAVQVQRPISKSNFESIKTDLQKSGKRIKIELSNGDERIFYAGGNSAKTTAYFSDQDLTKIFIVAIPGYKSYVSGIFELTANQWRDRVLFASSWRTLQKLSIDYQSMDRSDLSIFFDKKFLSVKGVNTLDTAVLMNYLQPLEYFQVNDYLKKGNFPRYDSLLEVTPLAKIEIEDIDKTKNKALTIYPKIPGEQFYLVTDLVGEMIVIDVGRMEKILSTPDIFLAK